MRRIIFTFLVIHTILFGFLQAQTPQENIAKDYILSHLEELNIRAADIQDLSLVEIYSTRHNGATHLFYQQRYNGIPVFNALLNVTVTKNNRVLVTGNRLISNLSEKITDRPRVLTPELAVDAAVAAFYPSATREGKISWIGKGLENTYIFRAEDFSNSDIQVTNIYALNDRNELTLCWALELDMTQNSDYWNLQIDAESGEILNQLNYTTYCSFNPDSFRHYPNPTHRTPARIISSTAEESANRLQNSMYKVFPFPGESPIHIAQTVLVDPEDTIASPYGWHDNDGAEGPEFTITRGNNVHAYLDEFDLNAPSSPEPDGGQELHFLFDYDEMAEPETQKEAAIVNLFYANNKVHDLMYRFGFDEPSGNFQDNNYGNGGAGGDYVNAEGFDASGTNNANFSTPTDGKNGRMQMYLWTASEGLRLEIHDPVEISGLYETGVADFGLNMDNNTRQGKVVIIRDNTSNPSLGCGNVLNGSELNGNIALIDRGICEFGSKVLHAQKAGAIGALVCNVKGVNGGTGEELTTMGPGDEGDQVTIPSLFVKKSTCDLIKNAIGQEKDVNITIGLKQLPGPEKHAASFDNGVIAHEYAHGISTRLTGGPNNSSCLYNPDVNGDGEPDGEQMGEGWSDFYALAFSTRVGDAGEDGRGIGTYVSGQHVDGRGIRHYPYSTDLTVSPVTYDFIKTTNVPHGIGEVWAATLWDLYWRMIEIYGFDPSWENVESGNFRTVLLVTDALKIQACNPGFLDGRDAILDADQLNYDGQHECLIWEVFSRRGMGYYAVQGDPNDHRDNMENFEAKPTCIAELKIESSHKQVIVPGENVDMQLLVTNHKTDSATLVSIYEDLPDGLTFVQGSSNYPASVADGVLTFEIGTIQSLEEVQINYQLNTSPSIFSERKFLDEMEEDNGDWLGLNNVGDDTFWEWSDFAAFSGQYSWYVAESELESDLSLIMLADPITIEGTAPALSFAHAFNTETLTDGGFVEYSTDFGDTWQQFRSEDFILNPYTGNLSYNTIAIPGLEAFYGESDGFIKSYIDLGFLKGQGVVFSFRYGTDDNTIVETDFPGWFVDDVEVIDLKKYEHSICATSAENDNVCTQSKLMIDSKLPDGINSLQDKPLKLAIGPNPARDMIRIYVDSPVQESVEITIFSLDGKELEKTVHSVISGKQQLNISTVKLLTGSYWVAYHSSLGTRMSKLIIQK